MIRFNNACIIRCYPISPRTQCTIASISKSITNNNPRLPAAREEEEEEEEGRNGIFPPPQSWCCLHHPMEKDISCPGRLCFHPRCCRLRHCWGEHPIPKLGTRNQAPEGRRQQLGMLHCFASLSIYMWAGSYPTVGINWWRREREINPHTDVGSLQG